MNTLRRMAAAAYAASLADAPLPSPPRYEPRKPSGKNRDKTKAARKQRKGAKR